MTGVLALWSFALFFRCRRRLGLRPRLHARGAATSGRRRRRRPPRSGGAGPAYSRAGRPLGAGRQRWSGRARQSRTRDARGSGSRCAGWRSTSRTRSAGKSRAGSARHARPRRAGDARTGRSGNRSAGRTRCPGCTRGTRHARGGNTGRTRRARGGNAGRTRRAGRGNTSGARRDGSGGAHCRACRAGRGLAPLFELSSLYAMLLDRDFLPLVHKRRGSIASAEA